MESIIMAIKRDLRNYNTYQIKVDEINYIGILK